MYTHTYPAEEEDFASTDASRLDTWVFTQVKVCGGIAYNTDSDHYCDESYFSLEERCVLFTVFNVVPFGITKTHTSHCELLISTLRLSMRNCSLAAKMNLSVDFSFSRSFIQRSQTPV